MTDKMARPGIGIIADRTLVRQRLRETLEEKGFVVVANIPPEGCSSSLLESPLVRAWVVDLNDEDAHDELLDKLADIPLVPVFYDMGLPDSKMSGEFSRWERRLVDKLDEFREPSLKEDQEQTVVSWPLKSARERPGQNKNSGDSCLPAERVWVIGASLGGPNAVKQFLDALPENLPVAFVYAQHIDEEFAPVLASTVARHSFFRIVEACPGLILNEGDVLLAPINQKIEFDSRKRLHLLETSWSGFYNPNIDEVMELVRQTWPETCGTIIFSGMGKDGSFQAQSFHQHERPVWVQTPESCASSVMPEAVIASGCESKRGTPVELAEYLIAMIEAEIQETEWECGQDIS